MFLTNTFNVATMGAIDFFDFLFSGFVDKGSMMFERLVKYKFIA